MLDLDEFEQHLRLVASDRPLMDSFKASNPSLISLFKCFTQDVPVNVAQAAPLPSIDAMTAIQVAMFDNGEPEKLSRGRPATKARYVASLEVWTAPADRVRTHKVGDYQRKALAALFSPAETLNRLETWTNPRKVRRTLSPAYVAELRAICEQADPSDLIGLLYVKVEGTVYHERQFVYLPGGLRGEKTAMVLVVDGDNYLLPTFSRFAPDGETEHGGRVILQSRGDRVGFSHSWATPDHGAGS